EPFDALLERSQRTVVAEIVDGVEIWDTLPGGLAVLKLGRIWDICLAQETSDLRGENILVGGVTPQRLPETGLRITQTVQRPRVKEAPSCPPCSIDRFMRMLFCPRLVEPADRG